MPLLILALLACHGSDADPDTDPTPVDTGAGPIEETAGDTHDTGTTETGTPTQALCPELMEAVRVVYTPDDLQVPQFHTTTWTTGDGVTRHGSDQVQADGTLSSSFRTTWDGDRKTEHLYGSSTGVDTTTYSWATDGSSMVETVDVGTDGTVEARSAYTYDTEGRTLSTELDNDGDGTPETYSESTWVGDQPFIERVDLGADGTWDHETFYTLDADGRPLRSDKTVHGREPDPNEVELWTWTGDCLVAYRTESYFFTNPVLTQWTYACDAGGHRIWLELDGDDDGTVDDRTEYDVDAEGHVLQERHYEGAATDPHRVITRTFDADGWPTSEEDDRDGDGAPDKRWTETWGCVQAIPSTPLLPGWSG